MPTCCTDITTEVGVGAVTALKTHPTPGGAFDTTHLTIGRGKRATCQRISPLSAS